MLPSPLDWRVPVVDLTHGLRLIAGAGLVGACQYHGILMMLGDEKDVTDASATPSQAGHDLTKLREYWAAG
jgi:hypothetical protein